jgi:predicted HicB family RNase H-like nuclease
MRIVTDKKPKSLYSGIFNFRCGEELHERLARLAQSESEKLRVRVSLNEITKKLLLEALEARAKRR